MLTRSPFPLPIDIGTKIDAEDTIKYNKCLVGIFMLMLNKITFNFYHLKLIIVHFGNHLRNPLLVEQG